MSQAYLHPICADHLLDASRATQFAQLSHADAANIAAMAQYQYWASGDVLSNFGDPLAQAPCFLVIEGNVRVEIALPDGRAPLVANVETPGCVFGTDALYMPTKRYARYVADGDVACALFTAASIDQLAQRRPDLAYKLVTVISAVVYRNFRVNVKRLAIDAAMQLNEKEQFEGELQAAQHRAKVAVAIDPDAAP
ncbi:MAG: Crp/Fnr family transcriptional regulator [Brachymonas sp.]|nr:Crp/Fnr family transcriptional regulator [Brachymonas sp.]